MNHRPLRIGIFGLYGSANLGNEATLAAMIQGFRQLRPDAEFRVFAFDPQGVQANEPIARFPMFPGHAGGPGSAAAGLPQADGLARLRALARRIPGARAIVRGSRRAAGLVGELAFLAESRRRLAGLDLLLTGGLGTISDAYGGAWTYPWNMLRWVALARSLGVPVAFASVGAGRLESSSARRLARAALVRASYVSARDRTSQSTIASLDPDVRPLLCPDLVLAFDPSVETVPRRERPTVGLVPVPHRDERYYGTGDRAAYEGYVKRMAAFAAALLRDGYRICFIPTQTRADPTVLEDLRRAIDRAVSWEWRSAEVLRPVGSLADVDRAFAETDFVVSSRLHGTILPLRMGIPVVAVFEEFKTREAMEGLGLGTYVLDAKTFQPDELGELFRRLVREASSVRHLIRREVARARLQICAQYEDLVGLAESHARKRVLALEQE